MTGPIILSYNGKSPRISSTAFIAPGAVLIGDVEVGEEASIWFGAVLRGDDPDHPIIVGPRSSVQDNSVIHVGNWGPTVIGPEVTVGHGATFESCRIGRGSLIGMNAVILQEAEIGEECLIAAGAVVTEKARFPDRSVVAGVPARIKKELAGSAGEWIARSAPHYVNKAQSYLVQGIGRAPDLK